MEGAPTANHEVEDAASRPDVDLLSVTVHLEDLGRDIVGGPATLKHDLVRQDNFGEAKVRDFDVLYLSSEGVLFYQDVLWLEISVNDSAALHEVNCLKNLEHDQGNLALDQVMLANVVKKLAAFNLVHHDVKTVLRLVGLSHLNDVGV